MSCGAKVVPISPLLANGEQAEFGLFEKSEDGDKRLLFESDAPAGLRCCVSCLLNIHSPRLAMPQAGERAAEKLYAQRRHARLMSMHRLRYAGSSMREMRISQDKVRRASLRNSGPRTEILSVGNIVLELENIRKSVTQILREGVCTDRFIEGILVVPDYQISCT
jgi:hypothetical protein